MMIATTAHVPTESSTALQKSVVSTPTAHIVGCLTDLQNYKSVIPIISI